MAPNALSADAPVEEVLPHLEALAQFTAELRARLDAPGDGGAPVGGIEGILALHRRVKALVDAVADDALARAIADVAALAERLHGVQRDLEALARVKRALAV
ncbi:MAG TPA: hypothetical protein VFD84_14900 [Candidatus Binatia bacterium]|nr:hypothetical protein [Candidatus Binatia bacterium]